MKSRIIILFSFSFLLVRIGFSNPIARDLIFINELAFDSAGNWKMEITYNGIIGESLDSLIKISTSTSSSMVKKFMINIDNTTGLGYTVLTNADLYNDLNINPLGDSIFLFVNVWYKYNFMIFGNFKNSKMPCPKPGQSIARLFNLRTISNIYSMDNTPSFGAKNDTDGMMGTLKGKVFDKYGKPLGTGCLEINPGFYFDIRNKGDAMLLNIQPDGSFSKRLYSFNYSINLLYDTTKHKENAVKQVDFFMNPDTIIYNDFHLSDSIMVNVKEINNAIDPFGIFPNPVEADNKLYYNIKIPVYSASCYLLLTDMEGRLILKDKIEDNRGSITLPTGLKSNFYMVQFIVNNKVYFSKKIIIKQL